MGHITLSIKNNNQIKPYIIVSAEYLNEAWIAEAYDDNSTKIIKQFKCKKFKNCFPELINCMSHLGEIVALTGTDIEERNMNRLRNTLSRKSCSIKQSNYTMLFNWLQNLILIPVLEYKLFSM